MPSIRTVDVHVGWLRQDRAESLRAAVLLGGFRLR